MYLKAFNFLTQKQEEALLDMNNLTCYNTFYPFRILSAHQIEKIEFEPITIFYGGNGCGKTTALNIIAEKLRLQRDTLFNKSNFFDDYLADCRYTSKVIPRLSRIITSDDVFDFTMNLRYINEGLNQQRESLFEEYSNLNDSKFRFKSLEDYDAFKKYMFVKRNSKSEYVRQNLSNNVREHSNGESGYIYFTDKIKSNALYLLDEPENSLSPEKQQELLQFIQDSEGFIIASLL